MREVKFIYTVVKPLITFSSDPMTIEEIENGAAKRFLTMNGVGSPEHTVHKRRFVGLNDKRGDEIYEGDLIKASVGSRDAQNVLWTVVFDAGAFQLMAPNSKDKIAFITLVVQCEDHGLIKINESWQKIESFLTVVGNIYENPELITDKKTA